MPRSTTSLSRNKSLFRPDRAVPAAPLLTTSNKVIQRQEPTYPRDQDLSPPIDPQQQHLLANSSSEQQTRGDVKSEHGVGEGAGEVTDYQGVPRRKETANFTSMLTAKRKRSKSKWVPDNPW